jgi:nucleotide-binding universal stress UspA family protein
MAFKTVLSVIGADQSNRDLKTAISLCQEINAHLSVLVIALGAPPPIGEYAVVSDAWAQEREAVLARLHKHTEQVTTLTADSGLSADVESEYSEMASADDIVGRRARYADLTILGPELLEGERLKGYVLNGALFESGTPVLIVPDGSVPTLRSKRILVAWDSRVEASRAVREALDLLAGADDVRVTLVDPEASYRGNGPEPGADIATYLARHGVKVTIDRLPSSGHMVADVLREHAVDVSADMIVMGGYGHSRLRERISVA